MKIKGKILLRSILILILCVLLLPTRNIEAMHYNVLSENEKSNKYVGEGYIVEFSIDNQWKGAFNGSIKITNTSNKTIDNWSIKFEFEHKITNIWNANICSHNKDTYIIKNAIWNQDIEPNQSINFGFSADYSESISVPSEYNLIVSQIQVEESDYNIEFNITSDWGSAFNGEISITNKSNGAIEDWILEFAFDKTIEQFWTADILESYNGHYIIKNRGYNANIAPGETLILGFSGTPGNVISGPSDFELFQIVQEDNDNVSNDSNNNEYIDCDFSDLVELNGGVEPEIYVDSNNNITFIGGKYTKANVNNSKDAINSLNAVKTLLGINNPINEFVESSVDSTDVFRNYRVQQVYKGIEVYGSELVITTDLKGKVLYIGGDYQRDLTINIQPTVDISTAHKNAKLYYGEQVDILESKLVIYSDVDFPSLSWLVNVEGYDMQNELKYENIYIDAETGKIIECESLLSDNNVIEVKGPTVYSGEKKEKFNAYLTILGDYELIDYSREISIYHANNSKNIFFAGLVKSDTVNGFNDRIANSAMVNLAKTYDYYNSKLKRKSYNGKGAKIEGYVHYTKNKNGSGWNNATSRGDSGKFLFGDGDGIEVNPRAAALDVVGHEFTHAVIATTCKLKSSGSPAIINEAFSDVMGAFVQGASGDAFWKHGDNVYTTDSDDDCTRNMKDPTSVKGVESYGDKNWYKNIKEDSDGGIHNNSTVISHIAYKLYAEEGFTKLEIRKIFYNTMLQLKRKSTLLNVRCTMLAVARNSGFSNSDIKKICEVWDQANICAIKVKLPSTKLTIYSEELK